MRESKNYRTSGEKTLNSSANKVEPQSVNNLQ